MRVCLIQNHSENNRPLWERTFPNHVDYCSRHRYDTIQLHRNPHEYIWDAMLDIRRWLEQYDLLLFVGSDVIFTRPEKPITDFWDPNYGLILSEERIGGSPINNDVMIFVKGEKANRVVDLVYCLRHELAHHPWMMQKAMDVILRSPEGPGLIKALPVRELQSTPVDSFPESMWRPGDFSLHFLAMSNEDKLMRCDHFLRTGEVLWRH